MSKKTRGRSKRVALLIIIAVLGSIFLWQGKYILKGPQTEPSVFVVERGEGVKEIATDLKKAGFIESRSLFVMLAFLQGNKNNLMAGSYELSTQMSVSEVLKKIASGDVLIDTLTVIEGWNLRDIGRSFENKGMFMAEELFEVIGFSGVDYLEAADLPPFKDFSDEFSFLEDKPKNVSLEGYLFPDTYHITRDEPILVIVEKMLGNFEEKITPEIVQEIENQGKTLFDILTMASMLEREVITYEDKQIVAGLLWKRLRSGWPLQIDATLTYLTGKASHELTRDDLNTDSLYNTYKYRGMPLGPICNPGFDSIKAALYYTESPYWFYLTDSEGEAVFSKTIQEHALNKQKYLR